MIDDRKLVVSVPTLLHRIRDGIRECEKYDIDYEQYVDKRDLMNVIEVLDCCINHKYSRFIERTDNEQ